MRLLVNPRDTLSLRRIINVPRRGIGNTTWARLEALARDKGLSGFEAWSGWQAAARTRASGRLLCHV